MRPSKLVKNVKITEGLYSKSWRELFDNKEAIVIERSSYDAQWINEIISLYSINKEQFDKYFPPVLTVEKSKKQFTYKYVSGVPFSSFFSLKRFPNYMVIPKISYRIGKLLGALHKEGIKSSGGKTLINEFTIRLKIFEAKYPHMDIQQQILKKFTGEIERLRDQMICIWHDSTPWNIIIDENEKIWFIDYFDAREGLMCEDLWKYIIAIDLMKWDFFPSFIIKKTILSFLQGYNDENGIDEKQYQLSKIIYEMFFLTYIAEGKKTFSRLMKKKYLEKKLREDLEQYSFSK